MSGRASLNHVYRTVWNEALGAMVAVAENETSHGRSSGASGAAPRVSRHGTGAALPLGMLALSMALGWGFPSLSWAADPTLPKGAVAIVGQATLSNPKANSLLVTTQNGAGGNFSAINWQSFSIGAGNSTYFAQPNAASTVINRVVTSAPSQLFGTLGSNGNLVLVNQSGITVGAGGVVDAAGFTASALMMSDADALAGRLRFGSASAPAAAVSVQGSILARSGDVVLIGSNVDTGASALIQAPNGSTLLAAGQQIEITGRGLEGITLQVQAPSDSAINLGTLKGDAVGIFAGTLKHSGVIEATAVSVEGGKVVLKAASALQIDGQVRALGLGGVGGVVQATANTVNVNAGALIDASGPSGGGQVLIGGGSHGKDASLSNAQTTTIAAGATLKADATLNGDGGTVVVWSDQTTQVQGQISARGGAMAGNGGFVETSGKQFLSVTSTPDAGAAHGKPGSWLLDPSDVTIQGATGTLDASSPTFSANAESSTILNTVINAALNAGTNVSIDTGTTGTQAGNIAVNAAITKSGGADATLTLSAANRIDVNAPITSTVNKVNLTLSSKGAGSTGSSNNYSNIDLHGGNLSVQGGTLYATNGSLLKNLTVVSIDGAKLVAVGTSTMNNVVLNANLDIFDSSSVTVPGTLTVNSGMTVALGNSSSLDFTGSSGLLTGAGTVGAGASALGRVKPFGAGAALTIDSGITIEAAGGYVWVGGAGYGLTNKGLLQATAGGTISLNGSNWVNQGRVVADGGTVYLDGTVTGANLGSIAQLNAGTLYLSGTWTNTDHNYDLGGSSNAGNLTLASGTIVGGTISSSTSAKLLAVGTNTLDNVTLDANLDIIGATVNVPNKLTVNSGRAVNLTGTGGNASNLLFTGSDTTPLLTGAGSVSLNGSGGNIAPTQALSTLTIGSGITVESSTSGTVGALSLGLINQGSLRANSGATLNVTGNNWVNQGTIQALGGTVNLSSFPTNDGVLYLDHGSDAQAGVISTGNADLTNATTGSIRGSGTLNLGTGTLTNSGSISPGTTFAPGTLAISGNLQLASGSTLNIKLGGTRDGQYDKLTVTGDVTLGGAVIGSLMEGYTPSNADAISFLTMGGLASGRFGDTNNLPAGFNIGYDLAGGEAARMIFAGGDGGTNTDTFTNASGTLEWSTPGNWSTGVLPGPADAALISSNVAVTHATTANDSIATLTINSLNSLNVSGGSLTVSGVTTLGGTLTVSGTGSAALNGALNGGATGQVNVSSGGTLTLGATSSLNSLSMAGGSLTSAEALTVASNLTINGGTLTSSGALILAAAPTLGAGGKVNLPVGASLSIAGQPYTIINILGVEADTTSTSLQGMNNALAGYYVLGSDLNATSTSTWNSGAGFTPIGQNSGFTGSFHGLGHTIDSLSINRPEEPNVGLFGQVGLGGQISNVGLTNASVVGHFRVGGLVGANYGSVSYSYATGTVTGNNSVGGLVGGNGGSVSNSNATDAVNGSSDVGGLVGFNFGSVSNSNATGAVSGSSYVGGLVGYNNGAVTGSYATGAVSGSSDVGGLAGSNGGSVSDSNATGAVTGTNSVGGLIGNNNGGSVSNSYTTGTVSEVGSGGSYFGGLVGNNSGEVINTYASGAVTGSAHVGGLVGYNNWGSVSNSNASGSVSGSIEVGGLVGGNYGSVTSSNATGAVSGNTNVGGLVGKNYTGGGDGGGGSVSNSYATGNVTGYMYAGGLVGTNRGNVNYSYSSGTVTMTGTNPGGGLIGFDNGGTVTSSYWDMDTSGQATSAGGTGATGLTTAQMKMQSSFVGWDFANTWHIAEGAFYPSFSIADVWTGLGDNHTWSLASNWSLNKVPTAAQQVSIPVVAGTSSVYLSGDYSAKDLVSFEPLTLSSGSLLLSGASSFNANVSLGAGTMLTSNGGLTLGAGTTLTSNGALNIGTLSNRILPKLGAGASINLGSLARLSMAGNSYTLVQDVSDLQNVNNYLSGYYALAGNVDASGAGTLNDSRGFFPIGQRDGFSGVFNGLGHVIDSLSINASFASNIGLFGQVLAGGQISNVGLTNVSIRNGGYEVGALVGYNEGSVSNSYATGTVGGYLDVGGLVGFNAASGSVSNSYATGILAGTEYGQARNGGGLIGSNAGNVSNSYASVAGGSNMGGLIGFSNRGSVTHSYWDMDTSGTATSAGGAGLTTAQMKQQASFVGWDFANTWKIAEGVFYPSFAITDVWTGLGDNQTWSLASNWSLNKVPTAAQQVSIPVVAGTSSVDLSGDYSAKDLVSFEPLTLSSGSLLLSGASSFNANVNLANSTNLTSNGGLTLGAGTALTSYGALNIGTLSNGLLPKLGAGATITLANSASLSMAGNPYILVRDVNGLQNINSNLSAYYALAGNVDASSAGSFTPIGSGQGDPNFYGMFNGLGHVINSLSISAGGAGNVGLFGQTGQSGVLTSVGLTNVNISGGNNVGGLVGYNSGTISNSYVTGSVGGNNYVGGLVGHNSGTISNGYVTGSVGGNSYVGGLVGHNSGTISNSYVTGSVSGNNYVGGLVGYNDGSNGGTATISNSHVTGSVSGNDFVGGLVGYNDGSFGGTATISNSYATGTVSGATNVGGLVGQNYGSDGMSGYGTATISNSYATGTVGATGNMVGGLVGQNYAGQVGTASISNSYATGGVSGGNNVGGLVGKNVTTQPLCEG